jgi:hypothetical protein
MQSLKPFRKKTQLRISGLALICLAITGCSSFAKGNPNVLEEYLPGLFSEAEFLRANDFALVDPKESFTLLFDGDGFKDGDADKQERLNWGNVKTYFPDQCKYENFWSGAPTDITASNSIKGIAVNFRSINMSVEDFMLSNASVLGQYVLVFESEEVTSNYFSSIAESLKVCSSGVRAKDVDGDLVEVGLKNAPNKDYAYYQSSNVLVRSSQDGLIGLDIFAKTKFSIVFYKIFVNDQNLPNKTSWNGLYSLLNEPIDRICNLEKCETPPMIDFASISRFEPSGLLANKPEL